MVNGRIGSSFVNLLVVFLSFLATERLCYADIKIFGFADITGAKTDSDNALRWIGNDGQNLNVDGSSRLGLNLNAEISDKWNFAGQLVARGFKGIGGQPGYIVAADWLFINYRPLNSVLLRVGRQIFPLFLYSEQRDVGFTYLWTRLPTVVYRLVPVKSFNGASAVYTHSIGDIQASAAIIGGSGINDQVSPGIGGASVTDYHVLGGYLSLLFENYKVIATYKSSNPSGSIYIASPGGTQISKPLDLGHVQNFTFGANSELLNFKFIAEVSRSISNLPGVQNDTGAYGTVGYCLWDGLLTPHFTFAKSWNLSSLAVYPNPAVVATDGNGALETEMRQWIVGVNLRASGSIIVKLEYEKDQLYYRNSSLNFSPNTISLSLNAIF